MSDTTCLLALDVGEKRIGLAVANRVARLAHVLPTITHDAKIWQQLEDIVIRENVDQIIVGLPRGLDGQETRQTGQVYDFAKLLEEQLHLPVVFQDEALTSWQAEQELSGNGKKPYAKNEVDALSAVYILEDYLSEQYTRIVTHE